MVDPDEVQSYHALSLDHLRGAETMLADHNLAPAYHAAIHALELGVKAALATRLARVPRTHNVGGLLGQEFLDDLGPQTCSRINQLVHEYDAPRYPDWDAPADVHADVAFIAEFLRIRLPALLTEARR